MAPGSRHDVRPAMHTAPELLLIAVYCLLFALFSIEVVRQNRRDP